MPKGSLLRQLGIRVRDFWSEPVEGTEKVTHRLLFHRIPPCPVYNQRARTFWQGAQHCLCDVHLSKEDPALNFDACFVLGQASPSPLICKHISRSRLLVLQCCKKAELRATNEHCLSLGFNSTHFLRMSVVQACLVLQ
jgi:hypothetical protein